MKIVSDSFRLRGERALQTFREEYSEQHQTTINRRLHLYGRIIRVCAIPALFYSWKLAILLFILGYLVQFLGHAIEGSSPSFFRNPKHLLVGSLNHVVSAMESLGNSWAKRRPANGKLSRRPTARLAAFDFIRWAVPRDGRSPRFYLSLLSILVYGRQSVYHHFKILKGGSVTSTFKKFFRSLALLRVPESEPASRPARLVARLLRAIYLTDTLPKKDPARRAGPNLGYINHPHFTYGEEIESPMRPQSKHAAARVNTRV